MPIEVDAEIRMLSDDECNRLAHQVIGVAFDVHNRFGRLLDEKVYQRAISRRCELIDVRPADREVKISVSHGSFLKSYFVDLLLARGFLVEVKTSEVMSRAHFAQALNYLLLAGLRHGLLINMRPARVKNKFVSTTLDLAERRRFAVYDDEFHPLDTSCIRLREILLDLVADWGAFLHTALYREAIVHYFGGASLALQKTLIFDGDSVLGSHDVCLIAERTAVAITALKNQKDVMRNHLHRFLSHTRLNCVQWINMDNRRIELRTLAG